jgi:hypothetical protein
MFFLDSGAGTTVIDRALGETLEFTKVGETTIGSPVGEPVAAEVLELSDVEIGGFPLERIECVMLDLADMMGSGAGAPRGVLSTRSFPGHTITLDFPQRVVELRRGSLKSRFHQPQGLQLVVVRAELASLHGQRTHQRARHPDDDRQQNEHGDQRGCATVGAPAVCGWEKVHSSSLALSDDMPPRGV